MTSQPAKQTIAINILPKISRCKSNQTIKFGQLIECNIRNIFLEKSYTEKIVNVVEKLFQDPFLKDQNWAYLWINSLNFCTVCFYCMLSWGLSKYIETKLQTTCFASYKSLLKTKRGLELVSPFHLLHNVWINNLFYLFLFICFIYFVLFSLSS